MIQKFNNFKINTNGQKLYEFTDQTINWIKKNKFKGKIGIFEINKKTITHQLNFYEIQDKNFKKIF